jgi:hypothetical protein
MKYAVEMASGAMMYVPILHSSFLLLCVFPLLASLCNFLDILMFTPLRLFIMLHYMFRHKWPSSGV